MMQSVFYWTGAAAWLVVAIAAICLAFEMLLAIAASVSWHRWSWVNSCNRTRRPMWSRLPKSLAVKWWELMGHRAKNGTSWTADNGGRWEGIGSWTVGWNK